MPPSVASAPALSHAARWGGRRPDGLYAEGPRGYYNAFWDNLGAPSAAVQAARRADERTTQHEQQRATRRRAIPAPAPVAITPHPRASTRTVRPVRGTR